jgi:soluble lytic murein transglycosylase
MGKIAVMVLFLLFQASPALSDIYRYVDENGVVCYTDAPVGGYRDKVKEEPVKEFRAAERRTSGATGNYSEYVHKAASKYMIEPELIHAVIKTESNGNSLAVSRKGAIGLMQLMPSTASDMNVTNPFDPEENIEGGTRYLRFLLEKFNGDLTLALAAYNAGPATVEKYGCVPPISETREYVKRVFSRYKGKKNVDVADGVSAPSKIYKVVLDDGTVLFTNSSLAKAGKTRF